MKSLCIVALSIAICGAVHAQNTEKFFGTWDFTTETVEVGYETGIMKISKESVETTFTNNNYKYPSEWVKYESDTLKYNMNVDGAMVEIYLVVKDASNLKGYAEWDSGETVLNLTKRKAEE